MQTLVNYMRQRPITKIEELLGKVVQSSSTLNSGCHHALAVSAPHATVI